MGVGEVRIGEAQRAGGLQRRRGRTCLVCSLRQVVAVARRDDRLVVGAGDGNLHLLVIGGCKFVVIGDNDDAAVVGDHDPIGNLQILADRQEVGKLVFQREAPVDRAGAGARTVGAYRGSESGGCCQLRECGRRHRAIGRPNGRSKGLAGYRVCVGKIDVREVQRARSCQIVGSAGLAGNLDIARGVPGGDDRLVVATVERDGDGRRILETIGIADGVGEGIGGLFNRTEAQVVELVVRIVTERAVGLDQEDGARRQRYRRVAAIVGVEAQRGAIDLGDRHGKAVRVDILAAYRAVDDVGDTKLVFVDGESVVAGDRRVILAGIFAAIGVSALAAIAAAVVVATIIVVVGRGGIERDLIEDVRGVDLRVVAEGLGHHIAQLVQGDLVFQKVEAGLADPDGFARKRGYDPFVAGGIDPADDRARPGVGKDIGADMAGTGIGENGELDDAERRVDEHLRRGAANTHGRDRRLDLHVAGRGHLAGDEDEGALHEVERHRGIGRVVRIVNQLVEDHPRIVGEREHAIVKEGNAKLGRLACLDHIALIDRVAGLKLGHGAVWMGDGRGSLQLDDLADFLEAGSQGAGLGVFAGRQRSRQRADDVAGKESAAGRGDVGLVIL